MFNEIRVLILIILTIMTSACANLRGAGVVSIPKRPFNDSSIKFIADKYLQAASANGAPISNSWLEKNENCRASINNNNVTELKKCQIFRNVVINDLLFIINHNYNGYEGNFLAGKAKFDFYSGATRSAFETGATLIDATGVKTVLSALAAFTGSTQTLANEAFYYEQTGPALINAMRADRKNALVSILAGMKSEYTDYPLTAAMNDLDAYFRSGTIASAVVVLSKATAKSEDDADKKLQCAQGKTTAIEVRNCP